MDKDTKQYLVRALDRMILHDGYNGYSQVGFIPDAIQNIARVAAILVYTYVDKIKTEEVDEEDD